ncbi:murein hydrolase transporter LrgB [Neisseria gonorrhoeae NG-k51.05]|nr:murein hydrolase transporter LrgB [Neisseria gonorrhoeae NG-k51.05]
MGQNVLAATAYRRADGKPDAVPRAALRGGHQLFGFDCRRLVFDTGFRLRQHFVRTAGYGQGSPLDTEHYLMSEILRQPGILLFLTLAVYALAIIVRTRTGNIFCNPVLVSTIVLIAYLKILGIDYAVYHNAAQFIDFRLKPAVVVLAVPLYQNRRKIFNQWLPVIVSQLAGSVTGIVTGMYFAKWLGAEREVVLPLASKSVTNPIAIEITSSIGGIPAITAATVIIAGLVGQIAGYKMLKNTVVMPSSVGMSLGTASHAMGIAASLERSRRMAAYAGMGLTFNGVLTALIAPLLIPVLGF